MDVLVKAAVLVGIIALGFLIKQVGWVAASDFRPISTIALRITLPCAVAVSFDSFDMVPSLAALPVLALVANLGLQVGGVVAGGPGRRGRAFGLLNVQAFNIGLFAIPYVSTFVGPQAIVYAAMFDLGNAAAAAGVGYGWGMSLAREDERPSLGRFLAAMFTSPVFLAYLALSAMRLAGWHLPGPVASFVAVVGAANTFLAMLMIGIGLRLVLPGHKYALAARLLGVRYALMVAFCVAVWFLPGLDPSMRVVVLMMAFAPMAAMNSAYTGEAGLDVETSAFMTSVSVLVGIVAMPLVLALAG